MNVTHLYCSFCDKQHEPRRLQNLCHCDKPLKIAYDLDRAKESLRRESLRDHSLTLWRYYEVLPIKDRTNRITFGEGITALLKTERLGKQLELS